MKGMRRAIAIVALGLAGQLAYVAPIALEPSVAIAEDSPEWDCATMGNRVCGVEGHEELIAEALSYFQGMTLPGLRFEFPDECAEDARGWHSVNADGTSTIKVCAIELHTLVHEITHAWDKANLNDAQRDELLERWGLETWADYENGTWGTQGAERLAIAFAYTAIGEAPPFFGGERALGEWQDALEVTQ